MRRLNKILLAFFIAVGGFTYLTWQFVQSESFARVFSKTVAKVTKTQLSTDLKFDKVEFQFFPPGAKLINVSTYREDVGWANFREVGVYFSLLGVWDTKINIDEILLKDGEVNIAKLLNTKKNNNEKNSRTIPMIQIKKNVDDILDQLRDSGIFIRHLNLSDVIVSLDGVQKYHIDYLGVENEFYKQIHLRSHLKNIAIGSNEYIEHLQDLRINISATTEKIDVHDLTLRQDLDIARINGEILLTSNGEISYRGNLDSEFSLTRLNMLMKKTKIGLIDKGAARGKCKVEGVADVPRVNCEVWLRNFITPFVTGEKLFAVLDYKDNKVSIDRAILTDKNQKVVTREKSIVYDIKSRRIFSNDLKLEGSNLELSNALSITKDVLRPLQGTISGKFDLKFFPEGVEVVSVDDVTIRPLRINFGSDTDMFSIPLLKITESNFKLHNEIFTMHVNAKSGQETNLDIVGRVTKNDLLFNISNAFVDFKDIGKIAGFQIGGKGRVSVDVNGKQPKISVEVDMKDFHFEQFRLQKVRGKMLVDIDKQTISIPDAKGASTQSFMDGFLNINLKTKDVSAHVIHKKLQFKGLQEIYYPIISKIDLPVDFYGDWEAQYDVNGKLNLDELLINGTFKGKNNYISNERVDNIDFNFSLKDQIMRFENIRAKKGKGKIAANYSINLKDKSYWGGFNLDKLPLSEIRNLSYVPLSIDGKANGEVRFKVMDYPEVEGQLNLSDTILSGQSFPETQISLTHNKQKSAFNINLLGNILDTNGVIDWSESKESSEKKSYIETRINVEEINHIVGMISFVDPALSGLTGKVQAEAKSRFNINKREISDLSIWLQQFSLKRGNIDVPLVKYSEPQLIISGGVVDKWQLGIKGKGFYLITKAEGKLHDNFSVKTKSMIDASALEVMNSLFRKASGELLGKISVEVKDGKLEEEVVVLSNDLSLSSDKVPIIVNKGKVELEYKNKKLEIKKFIAPLSAGNITASGGLNFENIIPKVNVSFNVEDATINLFKKTTVVLSGNSTLVGSSFPYLLGGDINIVRFSMNNEFTDFGGQSGFSDSNIKYLPDDEKLIGDQLIDINIKVTPLETMVISNSMANIGLVGGVQVLGNERDVRLRGKLKLAPRVNKVTFKNNEYNISRGNIFFNESKKISEPDFDFMASSIISDYKIDIQIRGEPEDFKIDLLSEPSLPKESIFSLIAFGYTDDLQAGLSDEEKESMRAVGVGALLFDRFKINETLKKEFGLQVNLGTEISKDNTGYLNYRNDGSSVGRVKSATTIEVKSQVSKDVTMSVSSTLGGTAGQKQSMNVNYNFNKTISVEGVYEKKTSVEGDQAIDGSSVGADLKMKWTFE